MSKATSPAVPRRQPRAVRSLAPLCAVGALAVGALAPARPALAQPAAAPAPSAAPRSGRALTFADFAAVQNVSDVQLAPDGRTVLYAQRSTDVAANRRTTVTYAASVDGGAPRRFPDDSTPATEARWSPDGRFVAYTAGGQLWLADAQGGGRRRLVALNGGASGPVWSPAGNAIVFVSAVWPECTGADRPNGYDDACSARRDSARAASKVQAKVADRLMYRHWNAWDEGTRQHLFVVTLDSQGAPDAVRDLTRGAKYDVPPGPFGGSEGYAVSPDGREVAFTAKASTHDEAWSTDLNVYTVDIGGGVPRPITAANAGADQNPVYSPDGRWIAYASQRRAGFESDRWRLMLHHRATRRSHEALPTFDRNANWYAFAPDARAVWVMTDDAARDKLFRAPLDTLGRGGRARAVMVERNNTSFSLSRDGRTLAWIRDAADRPHEVWVSRLGDDGRPTAERQLTHVNDALVAGLSLHPIEELWYRGANGDSVHAFVVKPPQWQPGRKYPAILLIHGGPQGAWLDTWHGRWNYQLLAAPGFALVVVNPRGSTGYGQRFVDEVSQDWGGRAYEDLMKGLDAALARYPWMDRTRLGATGGSYGGYMTNWIATHAPERFKAFATHAGVWNLEGMYGATEEIWFPEWEFGGPYWKSAATLAQYRRWSPHLSAGRLRTPHLVLHGELDYRVPYYEGVSLFTALQRQNVPSRFVVFPDEGHWIGKPQNQQLWWSEMHAWFARYLGAEQVSAR